MRMIKELRGRMAGSGECAGVSATRGFVRLDINKKPAERSAGTFFHDHSV